MIIVLSSDNNFVQHCAVTMASILKNNTDVTFYLFTEFLDEQNIRKLNDTVNNLGGTLIIRYIDSNIVKQFPMPETAGSHISIATYYRLFVELVLPETVDKIIYLDCDIVVRNNLSELWNTDFTDKALCAVYQYDEWAINLKTFERLKYPVQYGYFNAGVLLINLVYWRKNNVTQRLFKFLEVNIQDIISHDQDTLNAVLYAETKFVSHKWNLMPFFFDENISQYHFPIGINYLIEKVDPVIIHYASRPKPWEYGCIHPYKSEYYKYLKITPWKKWRPKFNLGSLINFNIMPRIYLFRRIILRKIKFL